MFGIDVEELLVIAVLALILFGPDKLPEYAAKLGRIVAKLREASTEVTRHYHQMTNPPLPDYLNETRCPQCSKIVSGEFAFCPSCGLRLKGQGQDKDKGPGAEQPPAT